jgi:2-C-methyl-D-erythritol 4-phosphate cytidylyltransferase
MSGQQKKEYSDCNGKPVLYRALEPFLENPSFSPMVITVPVSGIEEARHLLNDHTDTEQLIFVEGGSSRQKSVFNALLALSEFSPDYVLIHDGARPWVNRMLIDSVASSMKKYGACIPVIRATDALKEVDENGFLKTHLRHDRIRCAQTPQGFDFISILDAHKKAINKGIEAPDDAELYQLYVGRVSTVSGEPENRKITFSYDLPGREG